MAEEQKTDAAGTADQFNDDVDVGGGGQLNRIGKPPVAVERDAAILRSIARRNCGDDDLSAGRAG